jgi:hypothetical protein
MVAWLVMTIFCPKMFFNFPKIVITTMVPYILRFLCGSHAMVEKLRNYGKIMNHYDNVSPKL